MNRQEYFSFSTRQDDFDKAFIKVLQRMLSIERNRMIPPENEMKFKHGKKWITTHSNVSQDERSLQQIETVTNIYLEDITNHNLNLLDTIINNLVKQLIETNERIMFETISKTCEDTGRTIVQNNDISPAEQYLESIKSVEFSVNRDGRVTPPTFHASPERIELLKKDLESKGDDFRAKFQEVFYAKSQQALETERKRLDRFKK